HPRGGAQTGARAYLDRPHRPFAARIEVRDQHGLVDARVIADVEELRLFHHRVRAIGIEADIRHDLRAQGAVVPHEEGRAFEEGQQVAVAEPAARQGRDDAVDLPALAVRG